MRAKKTAIWKHIIISYFLVVLGIFLGFEYFDILESTLGTIQPFIFAISIMIYLAITRNSTLKNYLFFFLIGVFLSYFYFINNSIPTLNYIMYYIFIGFAIFTLFLTLSLTNVKQGIVYFYITLFLIFILNIINLNSINYIHGLLQLLIFSCFLPLFYIIVLFNIKEDRYNIKEIVFTISIPFLLFLSAFSILHKHDDFILPRQVIIVRVSKKETEENQMDESTLF